MLEAGRRQGIRWTRDEVTVLLTATVDLLALNPSITSYGVHPNEWTGGGGTHTAVQRGQFG